MNLENKTVSITSLSVNTYPPESKANVTVSEAVAEGIFKTIGVFDITFDEAFPSIGDPALLNAVYEKLLLIPD